MIPLPNVINDFFIILYGIVVGGIPFILLGAVLSAGIEVTVSSQKILKYMPKNPILQSVMMCLLGLFLPVCECGNIPFARRMIMKNIPPHLALTFLLAAPVFNPMVIISTIVAFSGNWSIVLWRVLFTFVIAFTIGFLFSRMKKENYILSQFQNIQCNHDHHHEHKNHHISGESSQDTLYQKIKRFFTITSNESIEMTGIFLFGASIASSIQLFLPGNWIENFQQSEWMSVIAMMVLAFIVSICANVDAFFALAYSQIFPLSSILAFLVLGPMIDIKAIPMLRSIFRWKAVMMIILLVSLLTFILSYMHVILT